MSSKTLASRSKRPDSDSQGSDSKSEPGRGKPEKQESSRGNRQYDKLNDRSPSQGRVDRNHNPKDGKNSRKSKERREPSTFKERRKEGERSSGGRQKSESSRNFQDHGSKKDTRNSPRGSVFPKEVASNTDLQKQSDTKAFTDDSRLSKLVRKVSRDDERERRMSAIRQLKEYIGQPENGKGIIKTADNLLLVLQDVLYERVNKEIKSEIAQCIGLVGNVMGVEAQRYFQWMFAKVTAAHNDEVKVLLLNAILQTLEQDDLKNKLREFMPMVMTNCQGVLENADVAEVLVAVVDIILYITTKYPNVFASHFRDAIDILVGWHIDATQKISLTNYTSEALIKFHPFWVTDLQFSVTLLGQFLEDMEAYAGDLGFGVSGQGDEDITTPEECISKIAALIRVFTTVVKSLGDHFGPNGNPTISTEYIVETVERVVQALDSAVRNVYSDKILTPGNNLLKLLVQRLESKTLAACDHLLPFIEGQAEVWKMPSHQYLISVLTLMKKVIEQVNTQLPVTFVSKLLGNESLLYKLRLAQNKEVLVNLLGVYQAFMSLKSVPLLEEAYRYVLGDLEVAYNVLLKESNNSSECKLVADNPFEDKTYNVTEAQTAVIFEVCALAEIGNTKNNLIGMWALSPSIFKLLTQDIRLSDNLVMERYPAVQFAFVQALFSHCARHGHFISSSKLITQNTVLEGTLLANVSSTTCEHFTTVLGVTVDLLTCKSTPYGTKCLVLQWAMEILDTLQSSPHIYRCTECVELVDALIITGYAAEDSIALKVSTCLQTILKHTENCPQASLKRCLDLCHSRISDNSPKVRQAFLDVFKMLPIKVSTSKQRTGCRESIRSRKVSSQRRSFQAIWNARRNHIARLPLGTFHSHNFRCIMGYMLHNISPSSNEDTEWLERMFHSSNRQDKESDRNTETISYTDLIDGNVGLQWFWATWEAAQFCVLAKLRTPIGKPQDTFTSIEGAIKKYASEIKQKENEATSPIDDNTDDDSEMYDIQLRVNLLLQFMENLEKLLYNAYEGCAVSMITPPKTVRTFFRTNKSTCQEWLMRIRLCLISVGLHCGQHAMVVRQAFELLRDMKETNNTQLQEFDHVIVYTVQALVHLRCPEVIQGLCTWCRDVVGKRITCIKAAVDVAYGRYEQAVNEYKNNLRAMINPELIVEEKKQEDSPGTSPIGSPKRGGSVSDISQKWSILSKGAPLNGDQTLDPVAAHFIVDQVSECYEKLGSLEEVLNWQETVQQYRTEHTSNSLQQAFYTSVDINYIKALSKFEDKDFPGVAEYLELVPGASTRGLKDDVLEPDISWDVKETIQALETQFLRAVTLLHTKPDKNSQEIVCSWLDCGDQWCRSVLRVGSALHWPPNLDEKVVMELHAVSALKTQLTGRAKKFLLPVSGDLKFNPYDYEVSIPLRALQVLNCQLDVHLLLDGDKIIVPEIKEQISKVRYATSVLARKQQNLTTAERLLIKEMDSLSYTTNSSEPSDSLLTALSRLRVDGQSPDKLKILRLERETSKLLHAKGKPRDGMDAISSCIVANATLEDSNTYRNETVTSCSELVARSLVTLVQWIQADYKTLSQVASCVKMDGQGDELAMTNMALNIKFMLDLEQTGASKKQGVVVDAEAEEEISIGDNPIVGDSDALLGRLLHLSTMHSPNLAKAWFALAGWCYKWGRKSVDNASHGSVELSADEKARVLELLPKGTSLEETERVLNILSQIHTGATGEEDISDQDQSLYDDGTEETRKQLLSGCLSLQIASEDCVDALLDVWRGVVKRVYHYYQLSAKSYLTYLKLNGKGDDSSTNMDGNVTATLRLLRLLVKHAWELRGVLEEGLASTPTTPWKGIIPQLFSRLNHPESYVRQSVSELLCRVAQDAPHLIVYPAVVGCSTKSGTKEVERDGLLNDYLSQGDEENNEDEAEQTTSQEDEMNPSEDPSNTMLQNCFTSIVDTLAHHNPRMIEEVQLLVSELRRITLLWDELWLGTLNQQHQDVTRRLAQLENEVKKVNNNASLGKDEKAAIIKEKHNTLLKATVFTMERLRDMTAQPAETLHEQWFQETYGKVIEEALEKLKNPASPNNPHSSWHMFKQLHRSLQERAQKRNSLVLNMSEISSKLGNMKETVIAMPGLSSQGEVVTIDSIHNTVQILPTKTKPKKMVFLGSDGKKYPYLFKGLEDLHLDERIMQFLSIVNNMFAKTNSVDKKLYHARHYSVTPLGARSGLIQWVDGATPLFILYKRWQQREALAQQLKQQSTSSSNSSINPPPIPRPSEVFYSKLTPALKEKGLSNLENRKEWPLSVMKQVLKDLEGETPKDLLSKELWCSSSSPGEWWQTTQTYARSTAVMSMIGYIIGLGDRHLDNVLVDITTGEVVHIDYNVCFEKGKSLRVPEKVPFRMTQNIENALGVTGVEGIFRLSCEHVIRTMRKGRETLLTLLEAFLYDPLVDWTTTNEGGYTGAFHGGGQAGGNPEGQQSKKEMEREITMNMFSIRVAEMKAAWFKNREQMLAALQKLDDSLVEHQRAQKEHLDAQVHVEKLRDQRRYLEEAKLESNHQVYTLRQRFDEYAVVRSTKVEVMKVIQEKLADCEHWHKSHQYALMVVGGAKIQKMCADVSKPLNTSDARFINVVEFLQTAGQGQLIAQCEQAENELVTVLHARRNMIHSCLDVLHTYATIVGQYPPQYVNDNRTTRWQNWIQDILHDFTSEKCQQVACEFDAIYGIVNAPTENSTAVLIVEEKLQNAVAELNPKLRKMMDRRNMECTDTSMLMLQVQETNSAVHHFMMEHKMSGSLCMTSVVVSALCSLSKRYISMEVAAAAAGDRLLDLTSRDGDWFLDELCSMSGNVNHLLSLLNNPKVIPLLPANVTNSIVQAMEATHTVYLGLQELNVNFRTIIVPEAVKIIQVEDPSVLTAIEKLRELVKEAGIPLSDILQKLQIQLMNAIMGMESTNEEIILIVKKMRIRFDELLQGPDPESMECLTPGQMLLMGFNGLFTRLDTDFHTMLDTTARVHAPDNWKKVDVVKEARSLQLTAFNETTLSLLSHVNFVKQIRAMLDFFQLCKDSVGIGQDLPNTAVYDDELFARPIKHFIAEYVRKQIIGQPSQTLGYVLCLYINALRVDVTAEIELRDIGAESKVSIEDLCKKAVELNLKNKSFEHVHLTQASALLGAADVAWRKSDLACRLDGHINQYKAAIQRAQLQLARFQWMHEDTLLKAGRQANQMVIPARATVMSELRKGVQALMSHEAAMHGLVEKHLQLESSITQRLKWAAGANPTLTAVLQQFESSLTSKNAMIQHENQLASEVVTVSNAVLHFEALRTRTPEALSSDQNFLMLINRCKESCLLIETCNSCVDDIEEMLMEGKGFELSEQIDQEWVKKMHEHISKEVSNMNSKLGKFRSAAESTKDGVKSQVNNIRTVLSSHHKLMSDVRSILKSLAKQEEHDHGPVPIPGGIKEYVNTYKTFSENFTTVLKLVISEDLDPSVMEEIKTMVVVLREQIIVIYNDLVNYAPSLSSLSVGKQAEACQKKGGDTIPSASPSKVSEICTTPPALSGLGSPAASTSLHKLSAATPKKAEKITRDPRTGKAIQERNSYAVGVWRRVKLKLDGRDPEMNKRLSVAEQVDYVIKEATEAENLCMLYEGWTPWV